jgi:hypothetical protein
MQGVGLHAACPSDLPAPAGAPHRTPGVGRATTQVLKGAERLLRGRNVWFVMAECNKDFLKEDGQAAFLK